MRPLRMWAGLLCLTLAVVATAQAYDPGFYWRPGRDWTPAQNPDDDIEGTADVWRYQYNPDDADFNPANHQDLTYWSGGEWRQSSAGGSPGRWCTISASGGHPEDAQDSIRTWTSPVMGFVRIAGTVTNYNTNCGDGIRPYIHNGTNQLWTADIGNGGSASFDLTPFVVPGDQIAFRVSPKANQGCDGYTFNPAIIYYGMSLPAHTYQVGDQWQASADWTPGMVLDDDSYGTPGVWNYQYNTNMGDFDPDHHRDMPLWDSSLWRHDTEYWCQITASGGHPENDADSIRTWISPVAGRVQITGAVTNYNTNCGDGIRPYIHNESAQIWTADLGNGLAGSYNVTTDVSVGDRISFRVNKKAEQGCDGYSFDPTITYLGHAYQVGDSWQPSLDWTPATNPDNDRFGTPDVWTYQYNTNDADFDPDNHQNLSYWIGNEWRQSSASGSPGRYCLLNPSGGHPEDAQDVIRTFTSPVSGMITIQGSLTNTNTNCGEGVRGYIHNETTQLWTDVTGNGGTVNYDLTTRVRAGDRVAFRVNPYDHQHCDSFTFNPVITYAGPPEYYAGDFWRPSRDWTAFTNPDDDWYGTTGVWRYQFNPNDGDFNPDNHTDMPYWSGSEWRMSSDPSGAPGTGRYSLLNPSGGHPDTGGDPIRTWVSPVSGNIRISGSVANTNPGCGDGIMAYIHHESDQQWAADLGNAGSAGYNLMLRVREGERLAFRVNDKANQHCDSFAFDPTITYMGTVSYYLGDYWQPTRDWTGGSNPDDDWYGRSGVWRYQYNANDADFDPANHQDMPYWTGSEWRQSSNPSGTPGTGRYCLLNPGGGHPDEGFDPIRTWVSPISGTVTIQGDLTNNNPGCGEGIRGYIHQNATELWNALTGNGGTVPHDLTVRVRPGDTLHFRVNPFDNQHCDGFDWDPRITYIAPYGLTGQWTMNEGSGAAQDSSGADYAPGGYPIQFSDFRGGAGWTAPGADPHPGQGAALHIPFGAEIRADRPYRVAEGHRGISMSAWIKYHGSPDPDRWRQMLIDSSGAAMLFLERRGSPGDYYWGAASSTWVDIGGQLQWAQANGQTPLEPEKWYNLVMTYDGVDSRLYLDGELEAVVQVVGTMNPGDKWFRLGFSNPGWEADADIDYLRLWDYPLSAEEILYQYMLVVPEPATLALLGGGLLVLARRRRRV